MPTPADLDHATPRAKTDYGHALSLMGTHESLSAPHVGLLVVGASAPVGRWRTMGMTPYIVRRLQVTPRELGEMQVAFCPNSAKFSDMWLSCWSNWSEYAKGWLSAATTHEKWLCARLLIPTFLVAAFPQREVPVPHHAGCVGPTTQTRGPNTTASPVTTVVYTFHFTTTTKLARNSQKST